MKEFILEAILYVARFIMQIIYFFIKLFTKQKDKVTMLSRQSDGINLDFELLKEEIEKRNLQVKKIENDNLKNEELMHNKNEKAVEIKILCKKIPKNILGKVKYCFYMIKCMYHLSTSKVCITDGYNIAISALNHKKNLKIVQIWHAMGAIKKFGYQVLDKKEGSNSKVAKIMKMHANYDLITCTSEATRKIYSEAFNTNMNKIQVLGMPRIDYILGKDSKINKNIEELYNEYPHLKEKKNILYLPTFRKGKKINIDELINSVNEEKYNLIISLHPLDESPVNEKYKVSKKYSTFDLIKVADYVITDYSAIAFETATLGKPLFFYLYDIDEYNDIRGLNIDLQKEMKNSTKTKIQDIIKIIENGTYDYEEERKFKEKYVETADIQNAERIVDYIIKNIQVR